MVREGALQVLQYPSKMHFLGYVLMLAMNRLANLRVGQFLEIRNGAIFGSMITYMRLVEMGPKSQAFLTQMVQFGWANCVSLTQNGSELASLAMKPSISREY